MSLIVYNRESPFFVWEISLPVESDDKSPEFVLWEAQWSLEIVKVRDSKNYAFNLIKRQPTERFRDFQVTIYVRYGEKVSVEHLGDKAVLFDGSSSYCIWAGEEFDVLDYEHETAQFILLFDKLVQSCSDLEDGHEIDRQLNRTLLARDKGIQTPLYLEEEPCLISLSKDLKKLESQNSKPDLNIQCGSHAISAHRNILASRSEVFEAMLQAEMVESRTKSVEIVDMEFPVLQAFLGYLYTGSLPELTVELASRLFEVSDKYSVVALKKRCADFLKENVTHQTACGLLALADTHADEGFKDSVMLYILKEHTIFEDDEWNRFCASNTVLANEVLNRAVKEKYSK